MSQPTEEVETSGADSDGVDDEGTAFYDSESVSAFQPALRADIVQTISDDRHTFGTNSIIDFDVVPPSDEDVESDRQRTLEERDNKGDDVMADQESTDDAPPPAPVISPNSSLAEGRQRPPTSPLSPTRLREIATPTSPNGSLSVISSPLLNLKQRSASNEQASVSSSSQRSSLVKALANTFRRSSGDRSKSPGFNDTVKSVDREEGDKGAVRLPSEEEFHLAIDETNFVGPLKYIDLPLTKSWDSDISSITVRMDGANRLKNDGQELWWAVSTERFGNWFPTVVSHAVEAAEGFLSAKSIHSQKQQTALFDYATSEDSDDESSADVFDLPSSGGVADSKTQRQQSIARHGSSNEKYCSGALDLYSGHKRKLEGVEAEIQHFVQLIPEQKQQYGKSHLTVARSLFTLAVLYSRLGVSSSAPAIDCATEALRIQRECSATNDACRSLHFLAEVYILQKQYIAALSLYAEVLRMERAHFGHLSDETVNTLNCIGHVHALQNEFLSAMDSHQEALRILQESHGDNVKYPLVTETLCQIGSVYYRERNSFKKSKPSGDNYKTFIEAGMLETIARAHEERGSYKVAISFFEEKLAFLLNQAFESDPEDLDEVAETFSSLGMLNSKAGLLFEALDYFEKAEVEMKRLKCDEVHLATIGVLMGTVRNQLGDWQIALTLLQDSLHVLVREVGHEHETVAATWFQIGVVQAGLCKFENAMKCFTDAVDVLKRILGPNHPATLRARREIGNLYCINISECDTALELFDEILTAQRSLHGDRHPNIGETLHSIGRAYARRGDYASALQILEQTYYMRTEFLGHDVPCQADTLYEISLIHLKRKHYKRALQISDIVLAIREESLRDKHIDIALAFTVKGSCYVAQNKLEDADALLSKALNMAIEAVGDSHPSVAEIHVAMSSLHLKRCQFTLASRSIASALDIFEGASLKNDEYPPYKEAKLQLARIEHDEALFV
jgi:tetratricopeptide (TPR) repeat protein